MLDETTAAECGEYELEFAGVLTAGVDLEDWSQSVVKLLAFMTAVRTGALFGRVTGVETIVAEVVFLDYGRHPFL